MKERGNVEINLHIQQKPVQCRIKQREKKKVKVISKKNNGRADFVKESRKLIKVEKARATPGPAAANQVTCKKEYVPAPINEISGDPATAAALAHEQMSRFGGLSEERDLQCLRPEASLVLIYRPNVAKMKGRVNLAQPVNRTQTCGMEALYTITRSYSVKNKI
ncbi:hypothetical protein TNCV_3860311 [Trichonephila clavipes]|nr:hypothetical protein TNCV_3860311 [Trichonephila clavipes]